MINTAGGEIQKDHGQQFAFQVNLAGIIELLSHHLYSGPQVYLRELLQNATDAIQARRNIDASHKGAIGVELIHDGNTATLVFEDNGVGLTAEEVQSFLSTIGLSSKSEELARQRGDFIGQFGIGLLSGFMVTDEIVLITRSSKADQPAVEWRGYGDGRYTLKLLSDTSIPPGTKVYLRSKEDTRDYFETDFVRHFLVHYGCFLPFPIELVGGGTSAVLNATAMPWLTDKPGTKRWRDDCLAYGEKIFQTGFLDCFPLRVPEAGINGVAFVLPVSPGLSSRRADRVYLKGMLLADNVSGLLPDWAFFLRCVFNAEALNPNASRESLQEDRAFTVARNGLESCVREYLVELADRNHELLRRLLELHFRSIKHLAVDDDSFYELFIDWLPFETSQGRQSLKTIRAANEEILYAADIDSFRQLAQVAAAQDICLINAGYACDAELLGKIPDVFPDVTVRRVNSADLLENLEDLSLEEQENTAEALDKVEQILQPHRCDVEIKRFKPADLPALFTLNEKARFQRDIQKAKDVANDLWSGVLEGLAQNDPGGDASQLCLNWNNSLVRKLLGVREPEVLRRGVELLYVQALLQGHYPLQAKERRVLSEGLSGLLDLAIRNQS
jgi:molecular chaperone HtpG